MKFSELDTSKLTIEEKYELVMNGVCDYAKENAKAEDKVDFLIILGCRPAALKARVVKAAELYKRGYAKYMLFSGGHGWNRNVEADSDKDIEMLETVKDIVNPKLLGLDLSEKELSISQKANETEAERIDRAIKKLRHSSESQLMAKMMHSLSDIPQTNVYHEPFSNTTVENIKYTEALFRGLVKRGEVPAINKVMIVTSSFHCRRAMLTFKKYFKDLDITACPATLDFKEKGIDFSKEGMITSDYYRKQIENELNAIVNYTRNGSIEDCDIANLVSPKVAKVIKNKHEDIDR